MKLADLHTRLRMRFMREHLRIGRCSMQIRQERLAQHGLDVSELKTSVPQ